MNSNKNFKMKNKYSNYKQDRDETPRRTRVNTKSIDNRVRRENPPLRELKKIIEKSVGYDSEKVNLTNKNKKTTNKRRQPKRKRLYAKKMTQVNNMEYRNMLDTQRNINKMNGVEEKEGFIKDLGDVEQAFDLMKNIPQSSTIKINCEPNVANFINLAAQFPLLFYTKDIAVQETITTTLGDIGKIWACFVTLCYDLTNALTGNFSLFEQAPKQYVELFQAIMPKCHQGFEYGWITEFVTAFGPDGFYGTSLPTHLPTTDVSMSWPIGGGQPLQPIFSNTVALSDSVVIAQFSQVVEELWATLSQNDGNFEMVPMSTPTPYLQCHAAFSGCSSVSITDTDYCYFNSERPIFDWMKWVMKLGLAETALPNLDRQGSFSDTGYRSANNYMYRLIQGDTGKKGGVTLLPKFVPVEDLVNSLTACYVNADLKLNEVDGASTIDQTTMPRSFMGNVSPGDFVRAAAALIITRLRLSAALSTDQNASGRYIPFGIKYYVPLSGLQDHLPTWLVEWFASVTPTKTIGSLRMKMTDHDYEKGTKKRNKRYCTVEYLVPTITGEFYANVFQSAQGGDPLQLDDYVKMMYPNVTSVLYKFSPINLSNTPPSIKPQDLTFAEFLGTCIPSVWNTWAGIGSTAQGNMYLSQAAANVNTHNTMMHYTQVLYRDEDPGGDWTDYPLLKVSNITNRVPFNPNVVTKDLATPKPSTFLQLKVFCGIYSETCSMTSPDNAVPLLSESTVENSVMHVHNVSGVGYEPDIARDAEIRQHLGGGFGTFIKQGLGAISSILPLVDMFV
jgi:hypothetical protein